MSTVQTNQQQQYNAKKKDLPDGFAWLGISLDLAFGF